MISYLTSRVSRDLVVAAKQEVTGEVWPRLLADHEVVISVVVMDEISKGDPGAAEQRLNAVKDIRILQIDDRSRLLAMKLTEAQAIPAEFPEDALHVAIAAVNGCDFLLTWNLAHLNNALTRAAIRYVVGEEGFRCPETCSPEELFGEPR